MLTVLRFGLGRRAFVVAFILGLVLQISALGLRGTGDMTAFKTWALAAEQSGLFRAYTRPPQLPPSRADAFSRPDYPPLSVVLLWTIAKVTGAVSPVLTVRARRLTVTIKGLLLAARIGVFLLLLGLVFRLTGDPTMAWMTALATWLNPALILNGSTLGYLDAWCWAPGIAAIVASSRGHYKAAGLLLGIAVLTKHQGVLFGLPVLAAAGRQWPAAMRVLLAGGATVAVIVAPFVIIGSPAGFVAGLKVNVTDSLVSGNALNFWWLVTMGLQLMTSGLAAVHEELHWIDVPTLMAATGLSPKRYASAFVIGATLWMYARVSRAPSLPAAAAMGSLAIQTYFVFAISVHENHLVNAIPLAALAAVYWPKYWRVFWSLTAIAALNQYLFYVFGEDFADSSQSGCFWLWTGLLSLANMILLAAHAVLFYRRASTAMTRPKFRWLRSRPGDRRRRRAIRAR